MQAYKALSDCMQKQKKKAKKERKNEEEKHQIENA